MAEEGALLACRYLSESGCVGMCVNMCKVGGHSVDTLDNFRPNSIDAVPAMLGQQGSRCLPLA